MILSTFICILILPDVVKSLKILNLSGSSQYSKTCFINIMTAEQLIQDSIETQNPTLDYCGLKDTEPKLKSVE